MIAKLMQNSKDKLRWILSWLLVFVLAGTTVLICGCFVICSFTTHKDQSDKEFHDELYDIKRR